MGHRLLYCLCTCAGKDVPNLLHLQQFKTKKETRKVDFLSMYMLMHLTSCCYNQQTISDWMLVTAVCVLAGLDVLLLSVVTAVPQLRSTAILKQSVESPTTETGVC